VFDSRDSTTNHLRLHPLTGRSSPSLHTCSNTATKLCCFDVVSRENLRSAHHSWQGPHSFSACLTFQNSLLDLRNITRANHHSRQWLAVCAAICALSWRLLQLQQQLRKIAQTFSATLQQTLNLLSETAQVRSSRFCSSQIPSVTNGSAVSKSCPCWPTGKLVQAAIADWHSSAAFAH
jgi:hypothetical protein